MAFQVPVLADFRTQFPELAAKTDTDVDRWLGLATPFFNQPLWDDMLFLGMLYWVAHQLVLTTSNAGQQILDDAITKKVGDIMKTRDSRMMEKQADNPYYRTTYGQLYLSYQQLVGAGGIAV